MKVVLLALVLCAAVLGALGLPKAPSRSQVVVNNDVAVIVLFRGIGFEGESVVVKIPRGETIDLATIGWDGRYWSIIPAYGNCFSFSYSADDSTWATKFQYDSFYNSNLAQYFFVPPGYLSATDGPCPEDRH